MHERAQIFKPLEQHDEDDWLKVLRVDLLGAFFFIKQAFTLLRAGGAILNVSSIHAEETTPLVCSYAAAKTALLSLTRSSAIEGRAKCLRVNAYYRAPSTRRCCGATPT